jgi:DNA-directed RNA polymerase specialized sigma24 family protein
MRSSPSSIEGGGAEAQLQFKALRPLCKEVCLESNLPLGVDVIRFYLARWCQKASGEVEPNVDSPDVREAAGKIAHNLVEDGPLVDRLVEGDAAAWTELRRELRASARARVAGEQAIEFAEEAEQKIALILLTGTPPSQAAERLRQGPDGPRNEYVFQSPFSYWARAVLIHMIIDEQRRAAREREPPPPPSSKDGPHLDQALLDQARHALPGLVAAIRDLPPVQHSIMVHSLSRRDLDDAIRKRLHRLAPDMFSLADDELPGSDREIAERLGTKRHSVAASRSVARRKLARRDPAWALLLDVMLPHKTTKPLVPSSSDAANA